MADIIELITNRIKKLEEEQKDKKLKRDMLDDYLANDEEYISLNERAKEVSKRLSMHRQALFNEPENRKIISELKEINTEIKDLKAILSGELLTVYIDKNTLEFKDSEGNLRKITIKAEAKITNQSSLF